MGLLEPHARHGEGAGGDGVTMDVSFRILVVVLAAVVIATADHHLFGGAIGALFRWA